jgi:hypothetical protein
MTKRTKRRPAPKKRKAAKRPVKKTVTKRRVVAKVKLPESCDYFACKGPAVQIVRRRGRIVESYCERHKLTAQDIARRAMEADTAWLLKEGIPALRKLLTDYPNEPRTKTLQAVEPCANVAP